MEIGAWSVRLVFPDFMAGVILRVLFRRRSNNPLFKTDCFMLNNVLFLMFFGDSRFGRRKSVLMESSGFWAASLSARNNPSTLLVLVYLI